MALGKGLLDGEGRGDDDRDDGRGGGAAEEEEDAVESAWAGDAPQEKTVNDEMHEYFAGLFP